MQSSTEEQLKNTGSKKQMNQNEDRYDDEIDLFDLVDDIRDNFKWVGIGAIFTICLAVAFLFISKPVYQSEAVIKPANTKYLVELLSPQVKQVYDVDEDKIFNLATSALTASDYQKAFYKSKLVELKQMEGFYNEVLSEEQNFLKFSERFGFKSSGKKDLEKFYKITFKAGDPKVAANLLNEYISLSLAMRLQDIEQTVKGALTTNIKALEDQADTMRDQYLAQKSRRILELREALGIAKAVGQAKPVYHSLDIVGGQEPPLYLLGTKAITAEIKALGNRAETAKNLEHGEDFFIEGMPVILASVEVLKSVSINFSQVKIASIDTPAIVPLSPIKPRKKLILALAIVAGVFVGVFMALIVAAFNRHNEKIAAKKAKRKAA